MASVGTFSSMESLQKLEEFPTFVSSIKSFGKPIIPPLVNFHIRHEICHLRTAAFNREAVMLKRKKERLNHFVKEKNIIKKSEEQPNFNNKQVNFMPNVYDCDAQSAFFETCQDAFSVQNGAFVAMCKLSTQDIFSSVHKSVIVCPNVMNRREIEIDTSFDNDMNATSCIDCNNARLSTVCESCQIESNSILEGNNFPEDISVVPFPNFYANKTTVSDDEQSSVIADTECGSLPTVIFNHRLPTHDTDSESNITCITQSTDLEKYMEYNSSADCISSEDVTFNWGSKTISQLNRESKSDCASSETLINTENELTPSASVVAELNECVEDTLSTVSDTKTNTSENFEAGVNVKRAHSVDSYMKLLKAYDRDFFVKKSQSDPCQRQLRPPSSLHTEYSLQNCVETPEEKNSNVSHMEKRFDFELNNDSNNINNDALASEDSSCIMESNQKNSTTRQHIRRNSYTLEQPSPELIKALEDFNCNIDVEPNFPNNITVTSESKVSPTKTAAFVKVKVDVNASLSPAKAKKFSVTGMENFNNQNLVKNQNFSSTSKNYSQSVAQKNERAIKKCLECNDDNHDAEEISCIERKADSLQNNSCYKASVQESFLKNSNQEILTKAYQQIQENHKTKVQKLLEEQNKQWLKLQEDFKREEMDIYMQLNCLVESSYDSGAKKPIPEDSNFDFQCELKMCPSFDSSSLPKPNSGISPVLCTSENDVNSATPPENEFLDKSKQSTNDTTNISPEKKNDQQTLNDIVFENLHDDSIPSEHLIPENSSSNLISNHTSAEPNIIDNCMECYPVSKVTNVLKPVEHCVHMGIQNCKKTNTAYQFKSQNVRNNESHILSKVNDHDASLGAQFCHSDSVQRLPVLNGNIETLNLKSDSYQPEPASSQSFNKQETQCKSQSIKTFPSKLTNSENKLEILPTNKFSAVATKTTSKKLLTIQNKKEKLTAINPVVMKMFEKLPAFVKGYLTRRLFKTERVKNLIKTLQDTALLIGKLSEDLSLKVDSVSQNDVDFHRQLIVQLMTTFHNVYDIFCTISVKEQMSIIAESRNLILKQNPSNSTVVAVSQILVPEVIQAPVPNKKHKLSAATLKSSERRKSKTVIDSRTYTVSDLKNCKLRPHSHPTIKSHSVSPSRVCKRSATVSPKRKVASTGRSSSYRRTMNFK